MPPQHAVAMQVEPKKGGNFHLASISVQRKIVGMGSRDRNISYVVAGNTQWFHILA